MLSFKKEKVAKYFKFDEDTHTVQIIGDAPPEILEYSDGSNNFDVKKLYENFLQCVYQAVSEMSKNPSEDNFECFDGHWGRFEENRFFLVTLSFIPSQSYPRHLHKLHSLEWLRL